MWGGSDDWPQRFENATHTAALPYLFRNASTLDWFLGYRSFSPQERDLSDKVAVAWRNFAQRGDPNNINEAQRVGPSSVSGWKQFDSRDNFTFVLDYPQKQMQDGTDWYDNNEPYCSFWKVHFIGPFPP